MVFTTADIAKNLADYLSPLFPGVLFFEDPNQQGSRTPCMFLQQRFSDIKLQPSARHLRTIGFDLTYLEDYNLPNLQQLYLAAAETLDLAMETFPYNGALIRTYEREWRVDLDALHYKFTIKVRVSEPVSGNLMEELDASTRIVEKGATGS